MTRRRRNPEDAVLIYPEVEKVFATKGPESGKIAGPYKHTFTSKPAMYGLANGDILLTTRRRNPFGAAAIRAGLGLAAAVSRPRRRRTRTR